jgi:carboxymethylenebutenolidase
MNKAIIFTLVAIAVVVGGFFWLNNYIYNEKQGEPTVSNSQLMQKEGGMEITTSEVTYFENTKGFFARPNDKRAYPGVVMIHENRGLRPEIKDAARALAKEGYAVLAVDLLGGVAEDQTGARALTANFKQEVGVANMHAAAKYLRDQGSQKIASLGWCFGGRQSLELAISGEKLDATVVYYGGGMPTSVDQLRPIDWPVLGIFGDKDQAIPVDMVKTFEASLNTLGVENEIHIYPGVGHAFANPSGANYAPNETMDAWAKTLVFLKANLD